MVASRVDIYGRVKGLDVDGFLYAPPDPVLLRSKGNDVLFPEMVLMVAGVLEHGRLILPQSVGGGGGVLLETGRDGSLCLTNISAWARCGVGSSAGYVVDMAYGLLLFEFVFRMNEGFSQGASR